MLALFVIAAQAVPLPSAPMIARVPPIVTVDRNATVDLTPVTFDVEVRAGSELLWTGPMRVSGRAAANFSRQKNDAPAQACATPQASLGERSSLTLNLSRTSPYRENAAYNVRVIWERPAPSGGCDDGRGTRTVSLTETFDGEAARDVTINGDGGLVIRLRRR